MSLRQYWEKEIEIPGYAPGETTHMHHTVCNYCQLLRESMNGTGTHLGLLQTTLKDINLYGLWGDVVAQWSRNYGSVDSISAYDKNDLADNTVTGRDRMKRGWSWKTLDEWLVEDLNDSILINTTNALDDFFKQNYVPGSLPYRLGAQIVGGTFVVVVLGVGAAIAPQVFGAMILGTGLAMMVRPYDDEYSDEANYSFYLWNCSNYSSIDPGIGHTVPPSNLPQYWAKGRTMRIANRFGEKKEWPIDMPIGMPEGKSYYEYYNNNYNFGYLKKNRHRHPSTGHKDYYEPAPRAPTGWVNAYQIDPENTGWGSSPWYRYTGDVDKETHERLYKIGGIDHKEQAKNLEISPLSGADALAWPYGTLRSDRIPHKPFGVGDTYRPPKYTKYYSNFSMINDGPTAGRSKENKDWNSSYTAFKASFSSNPGVLGGAGRATHMRAYALGQNMWRQLSRLLISHDGRTIWGKPGSPIDGHTFTYKMKGIITTAWNDHNTHRFPGMPVHMQDAFYCFYGDVKRLNPKKRFHMLPWGRINKGERSGAFNSSWLDDVREKGLITQDQYDELVDWMIWGPEPKREIEAYIAPETEAFEALDAEPMDDYNAEYAVPTLENIVPLDIGGALYLATSIASDLKGVSSRFSATTAPDARAHMEPNMRSQQLNEKLHATGATVDPVTNRANALSNAAQGSSFSGPESVAPVNPSGIVPDFAKRAGKTLKDLADKYGTDSALYKLGDFLKNLGETYPSLGKTILLALAALLAGDLLALSQLCAKLSALLPLLKPPASDELLLQLKTLCEEAKKEVQAILDEARRKRLEAIADAQLAENERILSLNAGDCK